MPLKTPIKAVFFDLDDTLCGYWDASKAALRQTFTDFPVDGKNPDEMIAAWASAFRKFGPTLKQTDLYKTYLKVGKPTRDLQMQYTLEELGIIDTSLAENLGDSYGYLRDMNLKLFEESREVIEALKPKYKLGLITNGPADIQRQEVNTLGLQDDFDPILIEGEMEIGKPEAEVFKKAMELTGITDPQQILMVGNSYSHDIVGAINAGWQTAWIRRPSDVPPSQIEPEQKPADGPEPDMIIGNLRELLAEI